METVLVVLLGLIVGSFLNVVIYRMPRGQSVIRPASRCTSCKRPIRWTENIPVFSYLFLRGKCRGCSAPVSIRYPIIELLTAILFLSAKLRFGFSPALVIRDFPFLAILIAVTFIDLEHRIIPDRLSLGGLAWGLATALVFSDHPLPWTMALLGAAIGFGFFFGLAWVYEKITGRHGLGGGDVKLLAMLGAFLGPGGIFATILISSIFGSFIGISWAWYSRRREAAAGGDVKGGLLTASIPYGPFLVVGAIYYYLLGDVLWFQFTNPM